MSIPTKEEWVAAEIAKWKSRSVPAIAAVTAAIETGQAWRIVNASAEVGTILTNLKAIDVEETDATVIELRAAYSACHDAIFSK
jgi:hypothetical protein